MAYTEKVSLSGTALSFLLYECINSVNSQEGFLLGKVTSEITNHISDSHNDSARLDTNIFIKSVLPLPSLSLFYLPTGRMREDVLAELLASNASEVVGWYKFRRSATLKPTFRDKLITRGLLKYFEKYHGRKNFVSCNLTNKTSMGGATHTLLYRFGKMNCFDMFEYIDDVSANLGEKVSGYKKIGSLSRDPMFKMIMDEIKTQNNNSNDAVLLVQDAINRKLCNEAKIASKNESTIRELEAEIKQMSAILADKQAVDLQAAQNKLIEQKFINREREMAEACIEAMKTPSTVDILNLPCVLFNSKNLSDSDNSDQLIETSTIDRTPSPILVSTNASKPPTLNYAAAVRKSNETPSTSSCTDDLITFDVEEMQAHKPIIINDQVKCAGDSSPEY